MHYENLFAFMPAAIDCIKISTPPPVRVVQHRAALSHTQAFNANQSPPSTFYKSNSISYCLLSNLQPNRGLTADSPPPVTK